MMPNTTKRLAMVVALMVPLLASYGCASQNWVIDTVREMDKDLVARVVSIETAAAADKARVDQLTGQLAAEKARVDQLTGQLAAEKARVDQLTTQMAEVRGVATDARTRADRAQQKADAVDGRLTQVLANRFKRAGVQQVQVTFETRKSVLSDAARRSLEGILKVLAANPTYTADVVGYTDSVGKADSNVTLSWLREEAVRRFLVERGADLNRLFFIGVGEELARNDAADAAKRAKNRQVTVKIFKPAD